MYLCLFLFLTTESDSLVSRKLSIIYREPNRNQWSGRDINVMESITQTHEVALTSFVRW